MLTVKKIRNLFFFFIINRLIVKIKNNSLFKTEKKLKDNENVKNNSHDVHQQMVILRWLCNREEI